MIIQKDLQKAIDELKLCQAEICIHSSLRSFGEQLEQGAAGVVNTFLQNGCTLLVPTFSYMYEAKPIAPYMPLQNGAGDYSYFLKEEEGESRIFTTDSKEISVEDMGKLPEYILWQPESKRGNHPINSFTALGKKAEKLIQGQTWQNVYAPFKQLYEDDGYILLMGVSLTNATIIHYAEQLAGRKLFVRWAKDQTGITRPVAVGSCSEGFDRLYDAVAAYEKTVVVGKSQWRCYRVRDILDACTKAIAEDPSITRCENTDCERCADAIKGGPLIDESFWQLGAN